MQHKLEKPSETTWAYAKKTSYLYDYCGWIHFFGALKMIQVALYRSLLWLTYRSPFQILHKMNVIGYCSPNCLLEENLCTLNDTLETHLTQM